MRIPSLRALARRANFVLFGGMAPEPFLKEVSGVIHVGANTGQERIQYHRCGLRVLWIEPVPEVFARLKANLKRYPRQSAYLGLITDRDDLEYEFHIANNDGQSSSIFDLKMHKDVWPDVDYASTVRLRSTTLPSLLRNEGIDPEGFDALVMDTQGSELLVLQGALPILANFRYIKAEVADFEAYEGACQLGDLDRFLTEHGFREFSRRTFAKRTGGGNYYDIIYQRQRSG
ncbi:MAG: FkbM family methyltransferase [Pirellulales bacterium]